LAISIVIFVIGGVYSVFLAATVSEAWGAVLFGGSMVLFFAVAVIVDVFRKVSPPTMNRAECG
jgi:predicted membrane channel-forming protein YqfA (hemolysin III family)